MHFFYISFFLFSISLYATSDINTTSSVKKSYIDSTHEMISQKIIGYSKVVDTSIRDWMDGLEDNSTRKKDISMDVFFKNEKYIDDTDDTFVQLRLNSYFPTQGDNDYKYAIKAHIPLSRARKKLNLFIKNTVDGDSSASEEINNLNTQDSKTEVGINLFSAKTYKIKPKYSAGIRSLDPFVRARYKFEYKYDKWDIELSQIFRYSLDDEFSENSNIYFDTKHDDNKLFRMLLTRSTDSKSSGMSYGIGFHYYVSTKAKTAIRLSQTFAGNTEYSYTDSDNTAKKYTGINNYTTSIGWRKNIWKKWIYYQVTPSASFYKYHVYKENYSLNFLFEFYFGRYQNR